jgi:hypothetical protein
MPKFDMEWQYRTSCIVEADSLKAAKEAAQQHVDAGTLHEWANMSYLKAQRTNRTWASSKTRTVNGRHSTSTTPG